MCIRDRNSIAVERKACGQVKGRLAGSAGSDRLLGDNRFRRLHIGADEDDLVHRFTGDFGRDELIADDLAVDELLLIVVCLLYTSIV